MLHGRCHVSLFAFCRPHFVRVDRRGWRHFWEVRGVDPNLFVRTATRSGCSVQDGRECFRCGCFVRALCACSDVDGGWRFGLKAGGFRCLAAVGYRVLVEDSEHPANYTRHTRAEISTGQAKVCAQLEPVTQHRVLAKISADGNGDLRCCAVNNCAVRLRARRAHMNKRAAEHETCCTPEMRS